VINFVSRLFQVSSLILATSSRYDNAITSSKRLLDLYLKLEQKHYVSKQALTNVLLPLFKSDELGARQAFESQVSVPGFMNSEEGRTAEKILEVYQTGDEEALESILKSAAIRYLDNEIAKSASALRIPPGRSSQKSGSSRPVEKPVSEDVKDLQAQVEDEGFL
jgi:hypothetical protein